MEMLGMKKEERRRENETKKEMCFVLPSNGGKLLETKQHSVFPSNGTLPD
jgi:hypothetical protein